ncbi:MAG: PACE efflux transporter [Rubrivivax sp.]|nr:PACE efflux transporter [Rubrivivax sp.]
MAGGIRDARERAIQTLCFEAGGILLVAPLYALVAGAGQGESFLLIAVLALVVMCWSAAFNTVFDRVEYRLSGRVASDRPQRWRVLHAVLHEASAVVVTWPVIVALTGLSWAAALVADLGLTLVYAVYAYAFHRVYDFWRPVAVLRSP